MQRTRDTEARQHHTVPQFHMRRFGIDGRIYVFDRVSGKIRPGVPRKIAVERDFNTIVKNDGSRDSWPETRLAEIDDAGAKAIHKLIQGEELNRKDRWAMSFFIGFADTRGPAFRRTLPTISPEDLREARGFVDDRFARAFAAMNGVWLDPRTIERLALDDVANVASGVGEIGGMIEGAFERAMRFFSLQWIVAAAPDGEEFITSDRPLAVLRRGGRIACNPFAAESFRVFPFSRMMALFMRRGAATQDIDQIVIGSPLVRLVNVGLAQRFDRYLIGSSAAVVERVLEDAARLGVACKPTQNEGSLSP